MKVCVSRRFHAGSGAEFHKCVQIGFGHSLPDKPR